LKNNGFASLLASENTKIILEINDLGYPQQNVAYKINYYTKILIEEKIGKGC